MEDYGAAVLSNRRLEQRFKELDDINWGITDDQGKQAGAPAFIAHLLKISLGLRRIGVPPKAVNAMAFYGVEYHTALAQIQRDKTQAKEANGNGDLKDIPQDHPLEEYAKFCLQSLQRFFLKVSALSILPEDLSSDIALMPYLAKPGMDKEAQKLID